jgi:hypothetical protein
MALLAADSKKLNRLEDGYELRERLHKGKVASGRSPSSSPAACAPPMRKTLWPCFLTGSNSVAKHSWPAQITTVSTCKIECIGECEGMCSDCLVHVVWAKVLDAHNRV